MVDSWRRIVGGGGGGGCGLEAVVLSLAVDV